MKNIIIFFALSIFSLTAQGQVVTQCEACLEDALENELRCINSALWAYQLNTEYCFNTYCPASNGSFPFNSAAFCMDYYLDFCTQAAEDMRENKLNRCRDHYWIQADSCYDLPGC